MTLDEIKRELRSFSYTDLEELNKLLQSLLVNKPNKDISVELQLAYAAFIQPLQYKSAVPPVLSILKKDTIIEVRNALTFLLDWLKDALREPVRRTEIQPWFALFGELLVTFLEERKVPLSMLALIRQAKTVPSLVDQAFPGYIQAGVLKTVIMAMRRHD